MAYTTISELETQLDGNIIKGGGFVKDVSFFYLEDIKLILEKVKTDPDIKLSQLQIVNITFKKNDGPNNHNRHEITGLALLKSEPQTDGNGNITNTDWHDIVALAWPPYYIRNGVDSLRDDTPPFEGEKFLGSTDYRPGKKIFKSA